MPPSARIWCCAGATVPVMPNRDGDAYSRRHSGIAGRWTSTERGRRGCTFLLIAGVVLMVLLLVLVPLLAVI